MSFNPYLFFKKFFIRDKKTDILISRVLDNQFSGIKSFHNLSELEYQVYSQWGEDGIISWLTNKLQDIPNTFIEFGVENYNESNTRLLLKKRNWSGLVIDASPSNILNIINQDISWKYNLEAQEAFIEKDNINSIIENSDLKGDIGLLSIDIDGNDYWVWDAIDVVSPAIVVCEYNALLGDIHSLTIPYNSNFMRTKAHYSNLYFGASIRALISLGASKGYTFVGTTSVGLNAFFIRDDLVSQVNPFLEHAHLYPSKFRESRDLKGNLSYVSGIFRSKAIEHMPLLNTANNSFVTLNSLGEIYSPNWMKGEASIF